MMDTYISGLDIVAEKMIRMEVDPRIDEERVALIEQIKAIPSRIDRRPEFRYKVNALHDVVKRNYFCVCMSVAFSVCDRMHLC